uniref:Uncharacterized protein n=1 Tax=Anguilla anguilla TaxID=7936 RepID=A0A0E9TG01_ANGAN
MCLPPHTSRAPSFTPVWQYSTSLSRCALWFCGPWSVDRSSGSSYLHLLHLLHHSLNELVHESVPPQRA